MNWTNILKHNNEKNIKMASVDINYLQICTECRGNCCYKKICSGLIHTLNCRDNQNKHYVTISTCT